MRNHDENQTLVDAGAVADRLNVSRATVHSWRRRGEIPAVRLGGTYRFDLDAVLREAGTRVCSRGAEPEISQ